MSADPARDDAAVRRMVRAGDTEGLIAHFENFARFIASGYFVMGGDHDDVMQEARIGLAKAARDFRGDAGSSFRNFAELCIRRQVITAVKTGQRNKHTPLNDAITLDTPMPGREQDDGTLAEVIPIHGHDPVDRLIAREEATSVLTQVAVGLSQLEREVLIAVSVEDLSYRQAAFLLGHSEKTIDNALQRARRRLADPAARAKAVHRATPHRLAAPVLRRRTVYVDRRHYPDRRQAIAAAAEIQHGRIVDAAKRKLLDGRDRDGRGRPRKDGRLGTPVWRIVVEYAEEAA